MGPIELEFDYFLDADGAAWHRDAAFGVVIELALQAARQAAPVHGLRDLELGPELVLDRARRSSALCDPRSGRVEVGSFELGRRAAPIVTHLRAVLDRAGGREPEPARVDPAALGARRLSDALTGRARFADDAAVPARVRGLVASIALYEHGLEAALEPGLEDCDEYAVHPVLAACAYALARCWVISGAQREPRAALRARRFQLLQPGASIVRMRVVAGRDAASDAAIELALIAESAQGVAWQLQGLELAVAERERHVVRTSTAQTAPALRGGATTPRPGIHRGVLAQALRELPERARAAHGERFLRELVAALLDAGEPDSLPRSVPFRDLGLSSRAAVELASELSVALDAALAPSFVFDHPTLDRLLAALLALGSGAAAIGGTAPARGLPAAAAPAAGTDVAVIGMACRWPGAVHTPEAAWELLHSGTDAVTPVPAARVALAPGMARHALPAAFLDDVELFDAAFFGSGEREAAAMDPQHRLLLEVTWEALERAGIVPSTLAGTRTGVFVSAAPFGYSQLLGELDAFSVVGNEPSAAAGRLSYFLGLRGPSLCVDAACASSLVALCMACDSLRRGEIDLAIVGGANLLLEPLVTDGLLAAGVLSISATRCRAFDADADGYVRGEACGVLLLRRAVEARAAHEPVLAAIRGHAVAHGGRANGLGAPSREAQSEVIRLALAHAGIAAHEVGYVEAHGTGTALGDAVELEALAESYGSAQRTRALHVGSIKTNIGHTELAAGVASAIKTVLSLQHGELPPHLHLRRPAAALEHASAVLRVATQAETWPEPPARRIAAVNALGMSGTYAHVLFAAEPEPEEESVAPAPPTDAAAPRAPYVVAVHATSTPALRALAAAYAEYLDAGGAPERLAATTQHHRERFALRAAVLGQDREQLSFALRAIARDELPRPPRATARPKLAFLYSGLGGQHAGMGGVLATRCPEFHDAIAECDRLLAGRLPCSLFDLMRSDDSAERLLARATVSQPATFAIQHALTRLWRSWGVLPDIVMGHSLGELAAAHAAGVLELEDALWLAAERGRLMDTLANDGAMAAVDAPRERVEALIARFPDALWLAAVNAPNQLVISGTAAAIDAAGAELGREGFRVRRLSIPVAAHSGLLTPMLPAFERAAQRASYRDASLPIVSTLTGTRAPAAMASARYFCAQLRAPVEFERGMQSLLAEGVDAFIEIGPSATLLVPAAACVDAPDKHFVASQSRDRDQLRQLLEAALELYGAGVELELAALPTCRGRHDPAVPTYAFQRRRYWLASPGSARGQHAPPSSLSAVQSPAEVDAAAPQALLLRFPADEAVARLEQLIEEELRRLLDVAHGSADLGRSFGELGLSSLAAVQLRSCVQRWVGKALPPSLLDANSTARGLARAAWAHVTRAA